MERDLEALWPAAEPPPGFAERVVERELSAPPPRARARRAAPVLALAAVLALTAVLAMVFAGVRWHQQDHGTVFAAEPWTFAGSVGAVSVKPAAASGIVTFVSLNAPSSAAISAKSWLCIWPMQIGPRSTSPSGVSDSDVLTAFAAIGVSIVLPLS